MQADSANRAGIYVRLSNEDARAGESVSVENQILMLTKHVEQMGWRLMDIYVDDGFTGTNQNRPAFQRMLTDVKAGLVNVLLVKDLSRLGRNYLEVGNLTEVVLPQYGCHLVSLHEPLDEMMVFRNWFNEQHSKSTSEKVRAAKRVSAEHGKYLGAYAPYGYRKDADNRHRLVIDGSVAPNVRRIFELRAGGMAFRAIASLLNEDGIMPPKQHYYSIVGRKNPTAGNGLWSEASIKLILANEAYIGNVVQGKFGTSSYKDKRVVRKPKETWIRAEGQHEALIDRELWDRVQALRRKGHKPRRQRDGEKSLFGGLLCCADCDSTMRVLTERGKRGDGSDYKYVSYICGNYARSGRSACTAHTVNEKDLTELIGSQIRDLVQMAEISQEHIVHAVSAAFGDGGMSYQQTYQSELAARKKQVAKLDLLVESLYEDKVAGIVPLSLFVRQIEKYERDRDAHLQSIEALQGRIAAIVHDDSDWPRLIEQHKSAQRLDSDMLLTLVDKITVGEAQMLDGKRVKNVEIIWHVRPLASC